MALRFRHGCELAARAVRSQRAPGAQMNVSIAVHRGDGRGAAKSPLRPPSLAPIYLPNTRRIP